MSTNEQAVHHADATIELMIEFQPNLMAGAAHGASEATGEEIGKFFAALRSALIAEYLKTPHQ